MTNGAYATQVARDRNTRDAASGFVGHVTRFRVLATFLDGYTPQTVGGRQHKEYWIPAEGLDAFDRNIVGPIAVIATFRP